MNAAPTLRWTSLWVVALVALLPLPAATQAVLVLGVLAGSGWLLLRRSSGGGALLSGPAWALTSVLFCAYWLPEAIAALDAESGWPAWRRLAEDLVYLPLLWLAAAAVADAKGRRWVYSGLALVALAWALDGWIEALGRGSVLHALYAQMAQAVSALGLRSAEAISGRGGAGVAASNLWPGLLLAVLSPFLLDGCERKGWIPWLVAALVLTAAIALSAAPAVWIAYACVLVLTGLKWRDGRDGRKWLALAGVVCIGLAIAWMLAQGAGRFGSGTAVDRNAGVVAHVADAADLGRDAACVVPRHPLNGVGVGGLPAALAVCAATRPDQAAGNVDAQTLPLLIQVMAQTGLIGLLLWLAGAALAWRAWRFADASARAQAWPAMQALVAALFPLNASLPVYGGLWGALLLLLAGLYAGALWGRIELDNTPAQS